MATSFFIILIILVLYGATIGTQITLRRLFGLVFFAECVAFVLRILAVFQHLPHHWLWISLAIMATGFFVLVAGCLLSPRLSPFWKLLIVVFIAALPLTYDYRTPPDHTVLYWLSDVLNKVFYLLFGSKETTIGTFFLAAFEHTLAGMLVYVSKRLMLLHTLFVAANIALAWWLFTRIFKSAARFPPVSQWRMPPLLAVLFLINLVFVYWFEQPNSYGLFAYLRDAMAAGFCFQGFGVGIRLLQRRHRFLSVVLLVFAVALMSVQLIDVLVLLGLLDAVTGIAGTAFGRSTGSFAVFRGEPVAAAWPKILLLLLCAGLILRITTTFFGIASRGEFLTTAGLYQTPLANDPAMDSKHNRISFTFSNGTAFAIDRYEYPNAQGKMPVTSVQKQEARALCAAREGRLCTRNEWQFACSTQQHYDYLRATYSPLTLALQCNVGAKQTGMMPSGAMARCSNAFGVYDMLGNAWEWVDESLTYDFQMAVGGAWNTWDDYAMRCSGFRLTRDAQWQQYDASTFGFRCCYDVSR